MDGTGDNQLAQKKVFEGTNRNGQKWPNCSLLRGPVELHINGFEQVYKVDMKKKKLHIVSYWPDSFGQQVLVSNVVFGFLLLPNTYQPGTMRPNTCLLSDPYSRSLYSESGLPKSTHLLTLAAWFWIRGHWSCMNHRIYAKIRRPQSLHTAAEENCSPKTSFWTLNRETLPPCGQKQNCTLCAIPSWDKPGVD